MQYAILGTIQFDLITYFNGLEGKWGADYSEHARTEGKPRLQWIGDKLDEWTLKLKFHRQFCTPETELAKLRKALSAHRALAFVLANGDYKGMFVIGEISLTAEHTDAVGALICAEVALSLKEDADAPAPPPAKPAVVKKGAARPVRTVTAAAPSASATAKAASSGLAVLNAGQRAMSAVAAWRAGNVSDALGSLAGLADQGLAQVAGHAGSLGQVNIPALAQSGREVLALANQGRNLLYGLSAGNLPGRMASVSALMSTMDSKLHTMQPPLAQLAGTLATRRVA